MVGIGKRWKVGEAAPGSLPAPMLAEISRLEADLSDYDRANTSWTLTYLEGVPAVSMDGGPTVNWDAEIGTAYVNSWC